MFDISDFPEWKIEGPRIAKEIGKILMSHQSLLKELYNTYTTEIEVTQTEECLSMTSHQFWRLLRDCQVISYRVTIADFNRIFLRGAKNLFKISQISEIGGEEDASYRLSRPVTP